ncbi:DNA-binding capsular synthesis response regulator RcsB [Klebsiella pneumoniae]|uniref:DNA-binding capsular synthesis response regulator RcsB n=10 Tax=Gammaproteobacteria TaxID=1236 RepID=A0A3S4H502_KLEPN|nr:DNA-binding capsular synthesis response regulator RcsB [Klebsiella pneumoniae]
MNTMNVIIADDHPIVLFGIRKSLEQIEWVNVVGEFEDSTALINNLPKLDAHVLITDLSMPGDKYGDGITLIKYIKRHFPDLSIIVLTMNNNPAILSAVLDLDIEGIVLKQGAPTDLPKALAALQKGKKFTPESVSRLLEKISASGYGDKRLSPKESEVLRLFAEGFLVTEIAKKLNRSIKNHQQPEEIGDDEAGRRKRHRLAELPLFRLAERDGQRVISSPSPSRPGETELPIIPALYAPAPHIPSAFASVRRG